MSRELVERARGGDHDAFAVLAAAAISRLDAAAWLMLRDTDLAMDAVQNALVRAWRDLPTLRDPDRFDSWLYRLLINACTDEIRRTRRHRLDVDIERPDDRARDRRRHVDGRWIATSSSAASTGSIPRSGRSSCFITSSTCRCPRSPSTLGIPLGTVKSRLYRGLREMRAVLDADARPGPQVSEGRPA